MKLIYFITILLLTTSLFSQESPTNPVNTNPSVQGSENTNQIPEPNKTPSSSKKISELGFRIMKSEYDPYIYQSNANIAQQQVNRDFNLTGNIRTIYPLYFKFIDEEKKYGVEFLFSQNALTKAHYYYIYGNDAGYGFRRRDVSDLERNDYKLNYLSYALTPFGEKLYFGAGLRKIDTNMWSGSLSGIGSEKIHTLGPQVAIKSNLRLYDSLYLNLSLEFYYTEGRRSLSWQGYDTFLEWTGSSFEEFAFLYKEYSHHNTMGVFRGSELDISFSYIFFEKYKLYFGYNYNRSNFSYKNYSDQYVTYYQFTDAINIYPQTPDSGREKIRGYYFGISAVF
ncbi:hypothetical protein EHQ81_18320 [Leptospira selangorensis]|uniref:Porin n=1 Tax=Leptospira selangorensis TaxID=2484982 RepID=A0A5F2C4U9_9LEPT|nr:hypothetical protein [Leptospira selangorensis]TGM10772.1 hypothetical protein EHQ81_18320 [Leptospira selangorensis]TGM26808.1 hypothetical protein EHQ82_02040 [Leptospira selangorensis]